MNARVGFALSILAACAIHAVILLVPRAALTPAAAVLPTVEIDLSETPVVAMTAAAGPSPLSAGSSPPALPTKPVPDSTPQPLAGPLPETLPPQPPQPPEPQQVVTAPALEPVEPTPSLLPQPQPDSIPATVSPAAAEPSAAALNASAGSKGVPTSLSAGAPGGPAGSPENTGPASAAAAGQPAGSGRMSAGTDLVAPQPLAPIQPTYPRSARQSGAQGLVKVSATVDERGTVTSAEVLLSSGSAMLDRAAVEAVRRAVFAPARRGGLPVACRIVVPIRFQLAAAAR